MKKILFALLFVTSLGISVAQGFKVTNTSVGPLKIEMTVSQIPASIDGLYDRFEKDGHRINFYQGDDLVIQAECQYEGLSKITAYEKANVYVVVLGKTYKMGDNIKALKSKQEFAYWPEVGTISVDFPRLDLGTNINPDDHKWVDTLTRISVVYFDEDDLEDEF